MSRCAETCISRTDMMIVREVSCKRLDTEQSGNLLSPYVVYLFLLLNFIDFYVYCKMDDAPERTPLSLQLLCMNRRFRVFDSTVLQLLSYLFLENLQQHPLLLYCIRLS